MIRRRPVPRALQGDRLARVRHDCDANVVLISHDAAGWIEVDPAGAGNVDLDPGVSVAVGNIFVVVIGQMHVSGHEARSNSARAQYRDHEHSKVATTPAAEIEGADRILNSLLVSRYVLEGPPDGPCHVDQQFVRVGGSVSAEEDRAPAIEFAARGGRQNETFETGPIFRRIGKRIGAGKILDIGCVKAGRSMVETNVADKAKLGGAVGELGSRDMIAETVLRPGNLPRSGRDLELRFDYLLILVVARPQHHPVRAECDRLTIVICRNVSNAENRHCRPMIMDTPATCIATACITTGNSWAKYWACFSALVNIDERIA